MKNSIGGSPYNWALDMQNGAFHVSHIFPELLPLNRGQFEKDGFE